MALLETFRDNFDDNTITGWTKAGADFTKIAEVNNELEITSTAATTNYYTLESTSSYDLTGSSTFIQVLSAGNQALASFECIFYISVDANNKVYFDINTNIIYVRKVVASVNTVVAQMAYSSIEHRWLRFRESGGNLYFYYSRDGRTWNIFTTPLANPWAVTSIFVACQVGTFASEASAATCKFDNLNYVYATPTNRLRPRPFKPGIAR